MTATAAGLPQPSDFEPGPTANPLTIALINDYDIVLAGLAAILAPYRDRITVVEIDVREPLTSRVDIALLDSFGQPHTAAKIDELVANPNAGTVVVYTWDFTPGAADDALQRGAAGYLSKTLTALALVEALETIAAGTVTVGPDRPGTARPVTAQDWPGRADGITARESEILALITQGMNNADIAAATHLSPNTVKSYIRTLYRKIEVTSRTQATLWGVRNGFLPNHLRLR